MIKQTTYGTTHNPTITVTIQHYPEAQDIPDDRGRVGSGVLMVRVEGLLADLKAEVNRNE